MEILSEIFLGETQALIQNLAQHVENKTTFGSFSTSIYDTAWLAMIVKRTGDTSLLFPECLKYILETQNQDGGWPEYASEVDGILNTMASTIALKMHQKGPGIHKESFGVDIEERIIKARNYLSLKLQTWEITSTVHVGFEILIPTLLGLLEKLDESIEFPGRQTLMALNQIKLARFRPEILYSKRKTTMLHSMEAFVGKVDFDLVAHHIDEHGSMMGSPAATAAYLIHSPAWDESAEKYLRNVIALGSGKCIGGVPSAFPSSFFETTWILSTLLKAGLGPEVLGISEIESIATFLQSQFQNHGGIVGFDSGLLADVDDTAKTILALNLLGFPTSPGRMIHEFEIDDHFRTYKDERNESLSANCNALDAILHSPSPVLYVGSINKVTRFLCRRWYIGHTQDKWNLSEQYSMMLLAQCLTQLLKLWGSGQLPSLSEDLIYDQVPVVLTQIFFRTLGKQFSDGSWGLEVPSLEITAYAVLTLKAIFTIPWLLHFSSRAAKAIKQGSLFLATSHEDWGRSEYIWVEKVTYALPPLTRTYCIAALSTSNTFEWNEKIVSLAAVSSEKIVKLADFFARLPMFSGDERWILEADVAMGALFVPQLKVISSRIFPRQAKVNYKYLEYIPFTWIATNRQNSHALSNEILWEMMVIALLDYQLDEFMETVLGTEEKPKDFEGIKLIVRRLCSFPIPEKSNFVSETPLANIRHTQSEANGYLGLTSISLDQDEGNSGGNNIQSNFSAKRDISGSFKNSVNAKSGGIKASTIEKAEAVLYRFTEYIFKHPKVLQSPKHVRHQLHKELQTCMLAHIEHEEDNARLAIQQRDDTNTTTEIACFRSPRSTYFSWVQNTSADNTHCPFTFQYFSCLAAPKPGEPFFKGVRQNYLSNALCRHLSNLCRQYNDYGSEARDKVENNLNSLNFPEFHESYSLRGDDSGGGHREVTDMKKDLLYIGEYERDSLNYAMGKLEMEMKISSQGAWRVDALKSFVNTVDLYGQIYVAKDITNRVK